MDPQDLGRFDQESLLEHDWLIFQRQHLNNLCSCFDQVYGNYESS